MSTKKERIELYCCVIDGFCYEERDEVRAHLNMQHGTRSDNPLMMRKKSW